MSMSPLQVCVENIHVEVQVVAVEGRQQGFCMQLLQPAQFNIQSLMRWDTFSSTPTLHANITMIQALISAAYGLS